MLYALTADNAVTKYPIGLGDLKKEHPTTSFPASFAEFDYASYGVVEVTPKDLPTYNPDTQRVVEGTPALKNGAWEQVWKIEPLSAEEQQQILDGKAVGVRAERDRKLAESDWRIIYETEKAAVDGLGVQYPAAWAEYRQALRDIPQQPGFPTNVTWPDLPQ
jgi:hypothetical protein